MSNPIFIIGYKRSGTTMLRKILNAHPNICIPSESEYFRKVPSLKFKNKADLAHKIASLERCDFGAGWSHKDIESILDGLEDLSPGSIIERLYRAKCGSSDKVSFRWGDKKPQHWKYAGTLMKWYPNAQFVHITRNPIDVAASIERWMPHQVKGRSIISPHLISAWQWQFSERYLARLFSNVPGDTYFHIYYEDFVNNPAIVLARIERFLGVALNSDLLTEGIKSNDDNYGHNVETTRKVNPNQISKGFEVFSTSQLSDIAYIVRRVPHQLGRSKIRRPSFIRRFFLDVFIISLNLAWSIKRGTDRCREKI